MKKLFILTVIFALVFAGCVGNNNDGNNSGNSTTTLKIRNESPVEITDVIWNNIPFTDNKVNSSINTGTNVTKDVEFGSGYIYFKQKGNPVFVRTVDVVIVGENEQKVFLFNYYTIVVEVNNANNTGTLGIFFMKPQIMVKQGNDVINPYGDYSFDSVLLGNSRDIIFTIENTGQADLILNMTENNVINLTNNSFGYFSVIQQPFAEMNMRPGSNTNFIIRFSPNTATNNLNAQIQISTNSQTNSVFQFRVTGNGSKDYEIGDAGPGNGIIFFAERGQYKECSGELGIYNWWDAQTITDNFSGGGFTDWRLPDRGELGLLYENIHKNGLGGFFSSYYWSSTSQRSGNYISVYRQNFNNGIWELTDYHTSSSSRVRAVRSFILY